jgi:hypothetical protein
MTRYETFLETSVLGLLMGNHTITQAASAKTVVGYAKEVADEMEEICLNKDNESLLPYVSKNEP